MSVVSLPRPYIPVSTLYAFPHDCDDYGPLPAFIQLPKARDDNTLKIKTGIWFYDAGIKRTRVCESPMCKNRPYLPALTYKKKKLVNFHYRCS